MAVPPSSPALARKESIAGAKARAPAYKANTPTTHSQIAGVRIFFGPHQPTAAKIRLKAVQVNGTGARKRPIKVPTSPANATGTSGRLTGQVELMPSDD
jgi:hypothetical protein